jgi:hypothetical protein
MQSGALIEPNRHELRRDFVVSFEKRSPDPVAYSIYLLKALPSGATFSAARAPKAASNVNGAEQPPPGDIINENLSSSVRWNLAGQQHGLRVGTSDQRAK